MTFGRLGSLGRGFGRMGSSGEGGHVIIPGTIDAGGGSYVWTGSDLTPIQNHIVAAGGSSYAWTGQDATLTATSSSTLYTDLISFWEMGESSGTRADSVVGSANDLTDNNTVTGGNDGVAYSQFTSANSEYLSHADNAGLSVAGSAFSFNFWLYGDSLSTGLLVKDGGFGNAEFVIQRVFTSGHMWRFIVLDSSHGSESVDIAYPATGAWYMLTVTCPAGAGNLQIIVNDGTPVTASKTLTVNNSSADIRIGTDGSSYFNGRMRRVGFWKKVLSASEITQLYNSGNGLSYAAMA